jgi:hypothetical protein
VLASAQWLVVLRQWLSIVLTRIQGSQADGAVEVPDWLLVVTGCVCLGSLEQPTISSISAISKITLHAKVFISFLLKQDLIVHFS